MEELDIDMSLLDEKTDSSTPSGTEAEQKILSTFNKSVSIIEQKFDLIKENSFDDELSQNILRSQVAFLLSCVDYYFHEIIKYGILEIIRGERKKTSFLTKCLISVDSLIEYISNSSKEEVLENEIIYRNSYKTFLDPDKINESLKMIMTKDIFNELYISFGKQSKKELKEELLVIYKRRNSIVHQMDFNTETGNQNYISYDEVKKYIDIYKKFINDTHKIIIHNSI